MGPQVPFVRSIFFIPTYFYLARKKSCGSFPFYEYIYSFDFVSRLFKSFVTTKGSGPKNISFRHGLNVSRLKFFINFYQKQKKASISLKKNIS